MLRKENAIRIETGEAWNSTLGYMSHPTFYFFSCLRCGSEIKLRTGFAVHSGKCRICSQIGVNRKKPEKKSLFYGAFPHVGQGRYRVSCLKCKKDINIRKGLISKSTGLCFSCWLENNRNVRPYEALYNIFRKMPLNIERGVDLSYEEFLEFTKIKECEYCRKKIFWGKIIFYLKN